MQQNSRGAEKALPNRAYVLFGENADLPKFVRICKSVDVGNICKRNRDIPMKSVIFAFRHL